MKPMQTDSNPLLLVLSIIFLTAGCDMGAARSSGPEVSDSAGVQIVENGEYRWLDGQGWRLSEQPIVDIGVLEGDDNYQLFRVVSVLKLPDGRFVVANAGTHELRFYDSAGLFLSSSGREGGGPGEFQALGGLWLLGSDTLVTHDRRQRRLSFFDSDGNFIRSLMLIPDSETFAFLDPVGFLANGSLVVSQRQFGGDEIREGLSRDSLTYVRFDGDGTLIDSLGRFPGPEQFTVTDDQLILAASPPFGRIPRSTIHGDNFFFGSSDSFDVGRYSSDGRLQRSIRWATLSLEVTPEDIENYKQQEIERSGDETRRQFVERMFEGMPFPSTMPAYQQMLADAEGNLWVEEYQRPGDDQPRWTVFDPGGAMLGVVETPPNFTVYQIGLDFVLGRWTDDLDVEHVRLYQLIK
jgi:hypothetical protein